MAFMPTRRRRGKRAPKWAYPRSLERRYVRAVSRSFNDTLDELVRDLVLPMLNDLAARMSMTRRATVDSLRTDGWPDDVALMRERLTLRLEETIPAIEQSAMSLSVDLYKQNRNQWTRIQKAMMGVEALGQNEAWAGDTLTSWVHSNVSLMDKLTAEAATNVEGIVSRGLQSGLRIEEIAKQLVGVKGAVDKVKNKAKFIARDQIAKLNGQITEARQTELGVKRYIWRTSDDERVRGRPDGVYPNARPSHWVLEGRTCRWDDVSAVLGANGKWIKRASLSPPGYVGHPGSDYQDRCYPEPILDEIIEEAAGAFA